MAEAVLIRSEFDPPPPDGMRRALVLAVLAHVLLFLALAWGLRWKKDADTSIEAELWAAVPMQAAPAHRTPPPAPVQTTPEPRPVTPKPPPTPVPPVIDNSVVRDAEIALAQKKEQERIQRELKLREEAQKKAAEEARRKEMERKAAEQRAEAERKAAKEKKLAEQKAEAERKAAEEAKRKEAAAKAEAERKTQAETKAAEARRKAELDRLTRLAGSGESGQAQTSAPAGPSAGYAARVRGRVRPNITFTDVVTGNPTAEVEVRTTADGTIVASKLIKSSGVKAWDDAVLRAIEKTAVMPRDTDGRVPSPMILEFRPHD